jgi:environmental stress-induced protein Ves
MRTPFEREQLPSTPWKNGGGLTREIVRIPRESRTDDFSWRASIAELSASGPFSTFEGVDRVLVLLSGEGVHLQSSDGTIDHRLDTQLVPFVFAGESAILASLLGGTSTDFNVMTRRATTTADVRIVRETERLSAVRAGVLFAARGAWRARGASSTYELRESAGVWWDGESVAWDLAPEHAASALIAVRVEIANRQVTRKHRAPAGTAS